jgi:hypothetical protein
METRNTGDQRDEELWRQAKKRVSFRNHFIIYFVCNVFFWAMWYFKDYNDPESGLPWPLIVTVSWGFGLLWHYLGAFVLSNKATSVEKEYERLKRKKEQQK